MCMIRIRGERQIAFIEMSMRSVRMGGGHS